MCSFDWCSGPMTQDPSWAGFVWVDHILDWVLFCKRSKELCMYIYILSPLIGHVSPILPLSSSQIITNNFQFDFRHWSREVKTLKPLVMPGVQHTSICNVIDRTIFSCLDICHLLSCDSRFTLNFIHSRVKNFISLQPWIHGHDSCMI